MERTVKRKISKNAVLLVVMCALVYFVAYMGRLSYSANIAMVCDFFMIDNGTAGIVGTCLFASYGAGQVINGLLCKKYNPKHAIALSLTLSAIANVVVGLADKDYFYVVCISWLVNGFSQSILWPSIIRLLNRNLANRYLDFAVFIMSIPVSMGTFATYGISALFSALSISFKGVFFVAAVSMGAVACIWFFSLNSLKDKCAKERDLIDGVVQEEVVNEEKGKTIFPKGFIALFAMLAVFAIVNNFVKDGVTTWMPKILIEKYNLNPAISTFLTLFLPLFGVFGSFIALTIQKKTGNYVISCGVFYTMSTVLIALVVIFLDLPLWMVTLLCFMFVTTCMSAINNILTSIFPMTYSKNVNAGMVAGLIDGFCYVGSAITTFGLGAIRDLVGSWNAVFYLLLGICMLMVIVCVTYTIVKMLIKQKI